MAALSMDELLQKLGSFTSGSPGVTRLVYSEAWCDAQAWLAGQARALGLVATPDPLGNLLCHAPAVRPGDLERSVLMVGSHLDTTPGDGLYAGACGVLCALLVAAELRERVELPVVAFASCAGDENRFGECNPGARGLLGLVKAEELDFVRDRSGTSWRRALEAARSRGCAAPLAAGERPCPPLFHPALMLELHVEQGPQLDAELFDLGIVERIAGCRRLHVKLAGETRCAATTPMNLRRDTLAAAAEMVLAAERLARKLGPPAVAGAGFVLAEPGTFRDVPGACELGIEVRHAERARLAELAGAIGSQCRTIAQERGLEIVVEETAGVDPVTLSRKLADAAEEHARWLKIVCRRMVSGAAHDATIFARSGVPSLLLLLPSRHGVSHAPEEYTGAAQVEAGRRFLSEFAGWLTSST